MNDDLNNKRLTHSINCLEMLKDFVIKHPEIRITQLLDLLGDHDNKYFYEEPWNTEERWKCGLKHLEK